MVDVVLLGTIIAGTATLAGWSYLHRENFAYRLFENIFVATGAATSLMFAIKYAVDNAITPLLKGSLEFLIPVILGIMCYFFYVKRYRYLYRIPIAFMIGVGTGVGIRGAMQTNLYSQIQATIKPLIVVNNAFTTINNILILVGVVTSAIYFIFTFKPSRGLNGVSMLGRYIIMIGFGADFGQVVMGRMTYLYGRAQFMATTEAIYLIPVALAIIAFDILRPKLKKEK